MDQDGYWNALVYGGVHHLDCSELGAFDRMGGGGGDGETRSWGGGMAGRVGRVPTLLEFKIPLRSDTCGPIVF